ncbi:hypothetical protein HMPREF1870_01525 [Bacteroidales bacterium KA00344]|nr:hypothetical protein HMPREF1870_01525 [Bacteroidales bacterium KA00344]
MKKYICLWHSPHQSKYAIKIKKSIKPWETHYPQYFFTTFAPERGLNRNGRAFLRSPYGYNF